MSKARAASRHLTPVPAYFAHPTAIIEEGAEIGEGSKIWAFSHIMKGAKIGKNCNVGERVHIGANVVIGDACKIQNGVNLYSGVIAESYVFFGPNCQTTNEKSIGLLGDDLAPHATWTLGHILFKKGCAIGANAVVVCGTEKNPTIIGERAIVGAGAVVTRSVPAGKVVVGNPARVLESRRGK